MEIEGVFRCGLDPAFLPHLQQTEPPTLVVYLRGIDQKRFQF